MFCFMAVYVKFQIIFCPRPQLLNFAVCQDQAMQVIEHNNKYITTNYIGWYGDRIIRILYRQNRGAEENWPNFYSYLCMFEAQK